MGRCMWYVEGGCGYPVSLLLVETMLGSILERELLKQGLDWSWTGTIN